jgi:hypothetical protein
MRKRTPTWGLLVVALYAAYIAIYLAIIPPLQGFDSVAHFNYVNYLREGPLLPTPTKFRSNRRCITHWPPAHPHGCPSSAPTRSPAAVTTRIK